MGKILLLQMNQNFISFTMFNHTVCKNLQADLSRIESWCACNDLTLTISKCYFMRNYRNYSCPFIVDYTFGNLSLQSVDTIDDVGIRFDSNSTFSPHVSRVYAKALRSLYFVERAASHFKRPSTFKTLYKTIVLPHLTYCSVLYYRLYSNDCRLFEQFQHPNLRFAAFKNGTLISRTVHDYEAIRTALGLLGICM